MLLNEVIVMLVAFLGTGLLALALGMLIFDLFVRPKQKQVHNTLPVLPPQPPSDTSLDRAFFRLVEESGSRMEPVAAVSLLVGCGVIGGVLAFVLTEHLLAPVAGIPLGLATPIIILALVRWRRLANMRKNLPETLQIVADAVRAGHTLEEASGFVTKDIKGPLAEEFAYAEKQLSLGQTPLAVLKHMVRRIPLPEFRLFATAVLVHRKAGGNLPLLTERLAATARDRQEVHGHMLAVTAGSRISAIGMTVGSIIAMGMLAWLEPEYLRAFINNEIGPSLVLIAVALQLTGVFWVWRILKVSY